LDLDFKIKNKMIGSFILIGFLVLVSIYFQNYFSKFQGEYYLSLKKPSYQPPPITFGVVWTLLYIILWLTVSITYNKDKSILIPFVLLLVLFVLWTYLFFNVKNLWVSAIVLVITFIVACYVWKKILNVNKQPIVGSSFFLLVAWLFFASILNINTAILNQ
jgi:benzodiazapine receptor